MTKNKLLWALSLVLAMLFACFAFAACAGDGSGDDSDDGNNGVTDGKGEDPSEEQDTIVWEEKTWTYTDGNGASATLAYALYFPEAYSESGAALPLVTYMPDASYQRQTIAKVETAACPANWITEENMKENPAVFLVLTLTLNASANSYTALDDEHSEQYQVIEIIDDVCENYNIDTDRLYLTGQSLGGIFDWAANAKYPDKFAATVYVGCQMGGNNEKGEDGSYLRDEAHLAILQEEAFVNQKFIYIASRKDPKAPTGQDDVIAALTENNAEYGTYFQLDKDDAEGNSAALENLFESGYPRYIVGFPQVSDGTENNEHMGSFSPSYAVNAIYEWLLSQKKGYSDGDTVPESDLPSVRDSAIALSIGETKIEDFKKQAKLEWNLEDYVDGVSQYMISLSYTAGEDDKDEALTDVVYYVDVTTAEGTVWTYCLSSYKKNNGMGGAGTGLNLGADVTAVTIILDNPGELLDRDIYVTLKLNQR